MRVISSIIMLEIPTGVLFLGMYLPSPFKIWLRVTLGLACTLYLPKKDHMY